MGAEVAVGLLFGWVGRYARQHVAHLGWAFAGDALVRSGWLWRHITIARFSKIQVVSRRESPFDRRLGMASVTVDTAAAGAGGHALAIPFLAAATASELAATLSHQAAQTAFDGDGDQSVLNRRLELKKHFRSPNLRSPVENPDPLSPPVLRQIRGDPQRVLVQLAQDGVGQAHPVHFRRRGHSR